ncbi:MAG: ATP-dependent 6-phosphofructokinase [Chloroherpetonaceae bacterium]|nr:ATP-dependent 6-phosphofructokinase [Chloroherpetonaceae bacterium]
MSVTPVMEGSSEQLSGEIQKNIKTVGILTSGGDCSGLNATLRAAVKTLLADYGVKVIGYRDGFRGMIENEYRELTNKDVSGILSIGGTILGTSNKANPFRQYQPETGDFKDVSKRVVEDAHKLGIDALIAIGGDGTMSMAARFTEMGLPTVGIPKTIDNDLMATDLTFGFYTAVQIVCESIDRINTTAMSHHRVMVIEVMGRYAGWIALYGGMAGGADVILLPEIPYDIEKVVEVCKNRNKQGQGFTIIVIAEGAKATDGKLVVQKMVKESFDQLRLGGVGHRLAAELEEFLKDIEVRVTILGHLQRGGTPTAFDRILSTRFGSYAAHMVMRGEFAKMVALRGAQMVAVPISEVAGKNKFVPPTHDLIRSGKSLGISFGD